MKKLYLIFIVVFFISFVTSFEFDNVKDYDELENKVTISNSFLHLFPLGKVSEMTLLTEPTNLVPRGEDVLVAEIEIVNYENYDGFIDLIELFDVKDSLKSLDRPVMFRILDRIETEIVPHYLNCTDEKDLKPCLENFKNTTNQKKIWKDIDLYEGVAPRGTFVLGIFADVYKGDHVEWIPTLYNVRITEWAEWAESLDTGLIHYWPLNETYGSQTTEDVVGGYDGTLRNSTADSITFSSGMSENAINFSDRSNHQGIRIYNSNATFDRIFNGTEPFSVSFWAKLTSDCDAGGANGGDGIFGKGQNTPNGYSAVQYSDAGNCYVAFDFEDGSGNRCRQRITNEYMVDGVWMHYVVVYNGSLADGSVAIYVNGTSVSMTIHDPCTGTSPYENAYDAYIGEGFIGQSSDYRPQSMFDELAVWNRTLTQAEVNNLYNNGSGNFYTPSSPPSDPYPSFNNYVVNPPDNVEYAPDVIYVFNITISNSNGTAFLRLNHTNWTGVNYSDVFQFSLNGLLYRNYSYYYTSYGSGASAYYNYSAVKVLHILENSSNCDIYFNASSPLQNKSYFKVYTNCSSAYVMYRDGSYIANGSEQDLDVGYYNFSVFRNDSINYSNVFDQSFFNITGGTPPINDTLELYISGTTPIVYPAITDVGGSGCPSELTCTMDKINRTYGVGVETFNYSTNGNANFTPTSVTIDITINSNSTPCDIYFNASSPLQNKSYFKVYTNCSSAYVMYRDGSYIANGSEQDLDVGLFNFTVFRNDSSNYTNVKDQANFQITDPDCQNNITQTAYSSWVNNGSCLIDDNQTQVRFNVTYDVNNCGNFSNVTNYDYQNVSCNYCSFNVINETTTSWFNVGNCTNNSQLQNSTVTEYDSNYNSCYIITSLPSDLWNSGNNNTYFYTRNQSCGLSFTGIQVPISNALYLDTTNTFNRWLFYVFLGAGVLLFFLGMLVLSGFIFFLLGIVMFFNGINIIFSSLIFILGIIFVFSGGKR